MNCSTCNQALSHGQAFCTACGTKVATPNDVTQGLPPHDPSQPYNPYVANPPLGGPTAPLGGTNPPLGTVQPPQPSAGGNSRNGFIVGLGTLAILAIGGFFVKTSFFGSGGAASPEGAVIEFIEALDNEDPVGAMNMIDPTEVRELTNFVDNLEDRVSELGFSEESSESYGGFELEFDEVEVEVDKRGESAARVEITELKGTAGVNYDELSDSAKELAEEEGGGEFEEDFDLAEMLEDEGLDSLTVVTVKRGGSWYISIAFTTMDYWAENDDLPSGDFDYEEMSEDAAPDPETAVIEFAEAVGNLDFDNVARYGSQPEFSVLIAFEDTIEAALERAADEGDLEDYNFTVDEAETSVEDYDGTGSKVVIDAANGTYEYSDYYDSESGDWRWDGTCLFIDGECEDSDEYINDASDSLGMYFIVVEERNGWAVSLTSTFAAYANDFLDMFEEEYLYDFIGRPELSEPTGSVEVGDTDVELNDAGYAVVTFTPEDDGLYTISSDGGWISVYDDNNDYLASEYDYYEDEDWDYEYDDEYYDDWDDEYDDEYYDDWDDEDWDYDYDQEYPTTTYEGDDCYDIDCLTGDEIDEYFDDYDDDYYDDWDYEYDDEYYDDWDYEYDDEYYDEYYDYDESWELEAGRTYKIIVDRSYFGDGDDESESVTVTISFDN